MATDYAILDSPDNSIIGNTQLGYQVICSLELELNTAIALW